MVDVPDGASLASLRARPRRWFPTLLLGLSILAASVVPIPGDGAGTSGVLGGTGPLHLIGYAGLTVALAWAIGCNRWRDRRSWAVGLGSAVVAASSYGAAIEVLQASIPWRSFATTDVQLNVVGALLGALLVAIVYRRADR